MGLVTNRPQKIINLPLNIGNVIDVTYNQHLKGLLALMSYNCKYILEIPVQPPLVKKRSYIKNG